MSQLGEIATHERPLVLCSFGRPGHSACFVSRVDSGPMLLGMSREARKPQNTILSQSNSVKQHDARAAKRIAETALTLNGMGIGIDRVVGVTTSCCSSVRCICKAEQLALRFLTSSNYEYVLPMYD